MRRLLLLVALVLALAARASAEDVRCLACEQPRPIALMEILEGAVDPSSVREAADTTTRTSAVVAYGEGATRCTITVTKTAVGGSTTEWSFSGSTSCDRPLEQTGQARMVGAGTVWAPLCSGTRASCSSGGTATGAYTDVEYHVTLLAPAGQGWVAPPAECSGAGTDRLDCTF